MATNATFGFQPTQSFGYDFGGNPARRSGGDPSDFIPFRAKPPAPTGVVAIVTGPGEFLVRWTDYTKSSQNDIGFYWTIRYCPATLAGNNGVNWIPGILARSRSLGGWVRAVGEGQRLSWTYSDSSLSDGYILVVGVTDRGYIGDPSTPALLNISGNSEKKPDVATVVPSTFTVSKERSPYEVLRFDANYFVRVQEASSEFRGVHLHVVGYDGDSTPREIGSMVPWDGSSGTNLITYRLPVEAGLGSGVATLTNGLGTVNRVSGTAFDVGWLNRKMVFDYADSSEVFEITGITAPDLINITPFFTGPTGNYDWLVLSNSTFYFVPIGASGARVADYSTAATVTI